MDLSKLKSAIMLLCIVVVSLLYIQFISMERWSIVWKYRKDLAIDETNDANEQAWTENTKITAEEVSFYNDYRIENKNTTTDEVSFNDKFNVLNLPKTEKFKTDFSEKSLMLLFSSWNFDKEKLKVHKTLARLWAALAYIQPMVFTTDKDVRRLVSRHGWLAETVTHSDPECKGPPVLSPLFMKARNIHNAYYYGFANSDILFGDGLVKTLLFIHYHNVWKKRPVMIVGRRYNYDFYKQENLTIDCPHDVNKLTANGTLVVRSTDYFFTNELFPWTKVPEVTIGRPFVVRAIIGWALKEGIPVIDATRTIEAVHLTTKDGIFASWHKKGVMCNERILMEYDWKIPINKGHCECTRLETFKGNGTIHIRRRPPSTKECS